MKVYLVTIDFHRTKKIRWKVVIWNFTEVGLSIFYLAFIFERLEPAYHMFGTQRLERKWFIKNIIESNLVPCILYFITGQYLLLHAWLKSWAEMLQFADRLFYKVNTHAFSNLSRNNQDMQISFTSYISLYDSFNIDNSFNINDSFNIRNDFDKHNNFNIHFNIQASLKKFLWKYKPSYKYLT